MKLQAFSQWTPVKVKVAVAIVFVPVVLVMAACQSTQYLWQAAQGQWQILSSRTPIREIISDKTVALKTVNQLKYVQQLRQYARNSLRLPVGNAYRDYTDLQRSYVVWNLFVSPRLKMKSHTWCYPIAGCVSYQGYFSHEAAIAAARLWREKDYDTYVGGVAAYSTLGWFDDPVLNTFLFYDPVSLAALLFHELSHRKLYIENDTTFNESWATAVEQEAVRQFVRDLQNSPVLPTAQITQQQVENYLMAFRERQFFVNLVKKSIDDLEILYSSDQSDQAKESGKTRIIGNLKDQYAAAVKQNKISRRYQAWFDHPINNAKLLTIASYHHWVPGLRYKLKSFNGNWSAFYHWSEGLATQEKSQRDNLLKELNRLAEAG